ncbi:MAG: DNA polymerase I, partial [Kiritimatiellae bacterium]|nr:DNA polymerase I [Kiritimatiellia bacterium]
MLPKRYVLVDAMALAYRSFYGVKHRLTTREGLPTNALYGFIRAMDQLRERWNPTHWQVIFDGGIPAYRRELVPEYKAQRKPMPDELRAQLDPLQEYLVAAQIAFLRMEGQEADDVMATLAVQAAADGAEVLLATSDKDEFQMVNDSVSIISTVKDSEKMTCKEVARKTGVRPDQIVDWL